MKLMHTETKLESISTIAVVILDGDLPAGLEGSPGWRWAVAHCGDTDPEGRTMSEHSSV